MKVLIHLIQAGVYYTLFIPINLLWVFVGKPVWRIISVVILEDTNREYMEHTGLVQAKKIIGENPTDYLTRAYWNILRREYAASSSA